jgi:uncharacterized protein YbaR (Trm112 family)
MSGYELGRLADLIACPECHAKLVVGNRSSEAGESAESLVCTGSGCRLSYPVREGIPMLLVDEAESLEESAWQAAVGAAVVAAVGDVSEESETDVESETEAGEENES